MKIKHTFTVIFLLIFYFNTSYSARDSPDIRFVKDVLREMWRSREEILEAVLENWDPTGQDTEWEREEIGGILTDANTEERMACGLCTTFVGTIQSLIEAGLTFEEIRDGAVEVCYNVTALMGYDGQVMCGGLIDNYGPHVYYVFNVTDMRARDICEFHRQCDSSSNRTSPAHTPKLKKDGAGRGGFGRYKARLNKQDMLRIAHISDVHYDDKYSPGSPTDCNLPLCCRDYWEGTGIANEWGDYNCNVPTWTVELMLESLAGLQPHVIMQTGDTPSHALWEETQVGQIEYSRWLAEAIQDKVPGVPAYTCIGNHESYPTNLYYPERPQIQALNRNITEMYSSLSNWTEEAMATMEIAGYYSMSLLPGLRVVAINSNYGYEMNFYGIMLPESYGWYQQTVYIENTLLDARQNDEKVILLGHHRLSRGSFVYYEDWINSVLDEYGDIIIFQLQGHSHGDQIQLSSDENLEATSLMFSTSTMGTRTDNNPTFRIYYLDPTTYLPLEYDHYFINLTATIENGGTPQVELMYNSYEEYGMTDLSVASVDDFIDRMVVDEDLYYLYMWNEETRTPGNEPGACDGACREENACDMRTTSAERYELCMEQWRDY